MHRAHLSRATKPKMKTFSVHRNSIGSSYRFTERPHLQHIKIFNIHKRKTPNLHNTHIPFSQPNKNQTKECEWVEEFEATNATGRTTTTTPRSSESSNNSLTENSSLTQTTKINLIEQIESNWDAIPNRYKLVIATSLSFVICNLDKVNISVAIIPMAQDFGWSPTTAGLVQSSFFYGYLLSQIPGGYASSRFGGQKILPLGVGLWSIATAAVPILASTIPGLCFTRAAVGLGEGVAPSAATDLVARAIDTKERSRAISFIFGGLHVGSLLGLLIAPALIETFDWPSVFYLFGGIGMLWALWWKRLLQRVMEDDPALAALLTADVYSGDSGDTIVSGDSVPHTGSIVLDAVHDATTDSRTSSSSSSSSSIHNSNAHSNRDDIAMSSSKESVPWRAFLRNRPLQALAFTHFCNNWFHYTMLAWLPTFFTETLSLNIMKAAQVSLLPPLAAIAVSSIVGPFADSLVEQGMSVGTVRKTAQCAAFLGPAICLVAASVVMTADDGIATVACVTLALGLASFSLGGLYCNHADLSPRYAPVLLGVTNTAGAIPGIMGVAFTGWVYDVTGSWIDALFLPSIFFFVSGAIVYSVYGSADVQDFRIGNQKFAIENMFNSNAFFENGNDDDEKRE